MDDRADRVRARGEELLAGLGPARPEAVSWRRRLEGYRFTAAPDDPYVWLTCVLALVAAHEGNFGVGAVIVRDGEVLAEGRNQAFTPRLRTDHHAEMVALDRFEDGDGSPARTDGLTLYSSLECCPMCTVRLINSGIRTVLYAAEDDDCGMVRRLAQLPPGYLRTIASRQPPQRFASPSCSPALREWAGGIFRIGEEALTEEMRRR